MKRQLTKREEQIIRLIHHDHAGFSKLATVQITGLHLATINRILRRVKCKAPQLFPILTPEQKVVLGWIREGKTNQRIVNETKLDLHSVEKIVSKLYKLGKLYKKPKIVAYDCMMDNQIKRRF